MSPSKHCAHAIFLARVCLVVNSVLSWLSFVVLIIVQIASLKVLEFIFTSMYVCTDNN